MRMAALPVFVFALCLCLVLLEGQASGTEVIESCEPPCGCWGLGLGPPQRGERSSLTLRPSLSHLSQVHTLPLNNYTLSLPASLSHSRTGAHIIQPDTAAPESRWPLDPLSALYTWGPGPAPWARYRPCWVTASGNLRRWLPELQRPKQAPVERSEEQGAQHRSSGCDGKRLLQDSWDPVWGQ